MDTVSADRTLSQLLPLLRLALWETPLPEADLCAMAAFRPEDWNALLALAREQTVSGLLYRSVELLPDAMEVPHETLLQLIGAADLIRRKNRTLAEVSNHLLHEFEQLGFHPVVLKGSVCAARYPQPELRESGDIDLYLPPGEFDAAIHQLEALGTVCTEAPDRSQHFQIDSIDVDLHRHYFDLHCKEDRLPPVPSPEAELLMLSAHIRKHAIGTGVGLRQICDMATAVAASPIPSAAMERIYQRSGTWTWNKLLYAFLEDAFHLSSPFPQTDTKPLRDILLKGGNFGHFAVSRDRELQRVPLRRKAGTAFRLLRNLPFSLHYAPREILPLFSELTAGNLSS